MKQATSAALFIFFLVFNLTLLNAQNAAYFQQRTDYRIKVTLDDKKHILKGEVTLDYTNNSPSQLNSIYFHLWGNAYSNDSTAFALQQLKDGKQNFAKSSKEERGGYEKIAFLHEGAALKWQFFNGHTDVCKVDFEKPLKTGEKMTFVIPFELKIPRSFSRLGREAQSYQLTQWYPKPAVLDAEGWHAMPYLDWGEFYSEFGSFDVTFTCPADYVVGATGKLQTENEIKWLDEVIKLSDAAIKSKKFKPYTREGEKTLHYVQDNIHDFALFLDKEFLVQKKVFSLPKTTRKITAYAMFPISDVKNWTSATQYLEDAVLFYSKSLGDYPFDYVTAVQSALSAGSGMEYPMITVIGKEDSAFDLDLVITHEVGHNWFYGILGSNERRNAWLDEGMNSFYETRYVLEKYPKQKIPSYYINLAERVGAKQLKYERAHQIRSLSVDLMNVAPKMSTPIDALPSSYFYFVYHYDKGAALMFHLLDYLGTERFDKAMKVYYEQFKFKHPQPKDLQAVFEKETNTKLAWLFQSMIEENKKINVRVSKCVIEDEKVVFELANEGDVAAPMPISILDKKKRVLKKVWVEGFEGKVEQEVLVKNAKYVVIDYEEVTLDVTKDDNECSQ